jgi:hypothetical protein
MNRPSAGPPPSLDARLGRIRLPVAAEAAGVPAGHSVVHVGGRPAGQVYAPQGGWARLVVVNGL